MPARVLLKYPSYVRFNRFNSPTNSSSKSTNLSLFQSFSWIDIYFSFFLKERNRTHEMQKEGSKHAV